MGPQRIPVPASPPRPRLVRHGGRPPSRSRPARAWQRSLGRGACVRPQRASRPGRRPLDGRALQREGARLREGPPHIPAMSQAWAWACGEDAAAVGRGIAVGFMIREVARGAAPVLRHHRVFTRVWSDAGLAIARCVLWTVLPRRGPDRLP